MKEWIEQERDLLELVLDLQSKFLILPHPLTNFEIQKYYQNEPRFNGVYSRDNLLKIKDGVYVINYDEYSDIWAHWVDLGVDNNDLLILLVLV